MARTTTRDGVTPREVLLDIGDVVRRTGVSVSTLHVWERQGLLTPAGRAGLRRQYSHDVIDRIAIVLLCKRSGFTLAETAELLQPGALVGTKAPFEAKLVELREQRAALDAAIASLEHAVACAEREPLSCERFRAQVRGMFDM